MHLVSRTVWSLAGWVTYLGAVANAAGVLEVDIIFPRNETYAPTEYFPIVFAVQNTTLAKLLQLRIDSSIHNGSDLSSSFGGFFRELANANFTSDPFLVHHYRTMDSEGPHEVSGTVTYASCNGGIDPAVLFGNFTSFNVQFAIQKGAQKVDLVAATANDKTCSADAGVAIGVTDRTRDYPASDRIPAGTCAVLDTSSPTPTANPCRVKIDSATAAKMSTDLQTALCNGPKPPADCPKQNSAAEQLAVLGVTGLTAALGAVGFLLL